MRALLALPAAAALILSGCDFEDFGGMERYHEDFHYSHPLKSGGRLAVEGFNGSIEISVWDQETVDISGTKYARSQSDINDIRIDIDHNPDAVSIRASRPPMRHGNFGVRFAIKVPRKAVYDRIVTSNGAIRAYDGVGPARLKTSNGHIDVQRLHGALVAETSNGPIDLTDVDGSADVRSSNGHIRIDGLRGSLDASTSNSSVRAAINRAADSVRVSSSNGSIDLALPPGTICPVRAHTSNSSITLRLPGGEPNARLSASTSNGNITTDFEMRMRSGEVNRHHLEGTLGSGGPLIDLSSSNGSIHIVK